MSTKSDLPIAIKNGYSFTVLRQIVCWEKSGKWITILFGNLDFHHWKKSKKKGWKPKYLDQYIGSKKTRRIQ